MSDALKETVTVERDVPEVIRDLVFFAKDMRRTERTLARELTDGEMVKLAREYWSRQHGHE